MDHDEVQRRIRAVEFEIAQLKSIVEQHPTTRTIMQFNHALSLDTATEHEPKCDVCGGAKSQCMGVHSEGSRWPSC